VGGAEMMGEPTPPGIDAAAGVDPRSFLERAK
jgi:hypothetical protein